MSGALPERPRAVTGLHVTPGDPVAVHWLTADAPPGAGPAAPELALLLERPLRGPGVTAARAMQAVGTVHAALVHLDPDSPGGEPHGWTTGPSGPRAADLDLALEAVLVEVDGTVVDSAAGAAILGHPAEALAAAANLLGRSGLELEAGWLVLTGPLTTPPPAAPDSAIAFHFTSLGSLFVPAPVAG